MIGNLTGVPVLRFDPSLSDPASRLRAAAYAPAPASADDAPVVARVGMIVVMMHRDQLVAIALVQTEGFQRHGGVQGDRRNAQEQFVAPTLTILQRHEAVCDGCTKTFPRSAKPFCDACRARLDGLGKFRDGGRSAAAKAGDGGVAAGRGRTRRRRRARPEGADRADPDPGLP